MEAKQIPLIDLLKNVPKTARLLVEDNASTRSIPVGRLCAEAVEELERARALARSVMSDMTSYDNAVCPMCEGKSPPKKSDLKPNSLYTVGMAMSDFIGENKLRWSDTLRAVFEKADRDLADAQSKNRMGRDEALLRQALDALEAVVSTDQPFLTRCEAVIAAIRERLK